MNSSVERINDDPPAPGFTIEGYIVVDIGPKRFLLEGTVGDSINVQYHRSFEDALEIGTISGIAGTVAGALGIADAADFAKTVNDAIDGVSKISADLAATLKTLTVKITDLGINTSTHVYQFGFCVDMSAKPITVGGVQLKGFGMRITYAKAA